ncbi:zf-HC2 domain-containing protein [Corallococcus macrosporus]|uniref:Zf-HC2 domain-containing protein n=1 Tax=Corallococcus macrosporus TaxID=35 RepID=A0ABS3D793_9BACT|nr:zf-HC2 domain-containing protein [Corallococcus macrosporus]MBN8227539.1 zf-HC2 domain-containing protein [Corallococcus macrosporus]
MSCHTVAPELVAYHFGTLDPEARQAVEDHLPECTKCLREFIALKRELETSEEGPLPSPQARDRLRLAVAREVRPQAVTRAWSRWERPLALGGALAALAAALLVTYGASVREEVPPRALSRVEKVP